MRSEKANCERTVSFKTALPLFTHANECMAKLTREQLKGLVEQGVHAFQDVPSERFEIRVTELEVTGSVASPKKITASVCVRFLPSQQPYCCGEPSCHLQIFSSKGELKLGEFIQEKLGLNQEVEFRLKETAEYDKGVIFKKLR
jgi:hypothetical protein